MFYDKLSKSFIIDSPGFKEIGTNKNGRSSELDEAFAELDAYAQFCKFSNCTHTHEPACEVKAAVASGDIAEKLYERYIKRNG